MGFKTTNYKVKNMGIEMPEAYAQLSDLMVGLDNIARGTFKIQQDRDSITTKQAVETKFLSCEVDKDLPLHKQVYEKAKETIFIDWEDDIV